MINSSCVVPPLEESCPKRFRGEDDPVGSSTELRIFVDDFPVLVFISSGRYGKTGARPAEASGKPTRAIEQQAA
jgi:hypothetical protein